MFPLYDDNPHTRTPWLTLAIILANVVIQLQVSQFSEAQQYELFCQFGFIPARVEQLSNPQLVLEARRPLGDGVVRPGVPVPEQVVTLPPDSGQIYFSMFSMMFLHGGWWHLLGNMWFLWLFGNNIEDRLGHFLFPIFYLVGGGLALACQYFISPDSLIPTVGASGAVSAVLGAYAITFPRAKVRCLVMLVVIITVIDLPAMIVLGFFFVRDLLSALNEQQGAMQSGVAFWAHIGGFASGMILMPLLALGSSPPGTNWKDEADEQFRFDHYRDPHQHLLQKPPKDFGQDEFR